MHSLKLIYFKMRALAEAPQMLMKFADLNYEYLMSWDYFDDDWEMVKPTIPFQQLPILIVDDEHQIAQSTSIMRFLQRLAGMELQDPVTHSSFGSVVYQGSLDISSDDIQPCMFNVTSGMPSFSWECGYWRLFKAYMVNTFTRGGLFKSKQFTREMFKRVTRTKAELSTEKNKAEADNELLTLVTQLSNTGVTQQVPFAPQMHPLYRIGRVYNLIYFGHYKKMLEDLGKLGQLPRHPFIRNYKKYKKNPEKIKPDFINCKFHGFHI